MTYDSTVYRVSVNVIDNLRGALVADVTITNDEGTPFENLTFVNSYHITGEAQVVLTGTKTLVGRDLTDGEFTFELYETDESFLPDVDTQPIQTAVNTGGEFRLVLNYTTENVGTTCYYVVRERGTGQTIDGVTFSDAVYFVTVEILDNGTGSIKTVTTITNGETTVESLDFVNEYTAAPAEITISGTKTLEGRKLTDGEFTFELYETDASWSEISEAVTTTNGADATFEFGPITFTTTGKRYYLVKEVNGGQTIDYLSYDDTIYRITVEVTDDGLGNLIATGDMATADGKEVEEVTFLNTYSAPDIPKTGDVSLLPTLAIMAVSAGGIITLLAGKLGEEEEE